MLPPLRERAGDIPELIQQFFDRSRQKHNRPDLALSPAAMPHLVNTGGRQRSRTGERYRAPGALVPFRRSRRRGSSRQHPAAPDIAGPAAPVPAVTEAGLNAVERELIVKALQRANWNQTKAARQLAISRKTLLYRMGKYGITRTGEKERCRSKEAAGSDS